MHRIYQASAPQRIVTLGDVKFGSGQLNGSKSDFNLVYDHLMEVRDLPSRNAAKRYLNERGLTPHHVDSETIQFVPKGLQSMSLM